MSLSNFSAEEMEVYHHIIAADEEVLRTDELLGADPETKQNQEEEEIADWRRHLRIVAGLPRTYQVFPPEAPDYPDPRLEGQPLRLNISIPQECLDRKKDRYNWKWYCHTHYGKLVTHMSGMEQRFARLSVARRDPKASPHDPRKLAAAEQASLELAAEREELQPAPRYQASNRHAPLQPEFRRPFPGHGPSHTQQRKIGGNRSRSPSDRELHKRRR